MASLERFAGQQAVWVTVINAGYVPFLRNFLASLRAARVRLPLLVLGLDEGALDGARAVSGSDGTDVVVQALAPPFRRVLPTALQAFGTDEYKRVVFAKLDGLAWAMERLRALGVAWVGHMDMDVVVLSDPWAPFVAAIDAHPLVSVFTQCDEGAPSPCECSHPTRCPNGCTGVMLLRNTPELQALLTYSADDMCAYLTDQHFLMARLDAAGVARRTLPRAVLLNGRYADVARKRRPELPAQAALVHVNWCKNAHKQPLLRAWGWWLVG